MTDEQAERLKQIRERLTSNQALLPTRDEADFLLSLFDSQSAEDCTRVKMGKWEFTEDELEQQYLDATRLGAATSMRCRCVEKVKEMRDEWESKRNGLEPLSKMRNRYDAGFCAANEIITALESLPFDQVEQEK